MKIRTIDGAEFEGKTAAEVVMMLHRSAFNPEEDDRRYMEATAKRAETQTGRPVPCSGAEEFLNGLKDVGLIEILEG